VKRDTNIYRLFLSELLDPSFLHNSTPSMFPFHLCFFSIPFTFPVPYSRPYLLLFIFPTRLFLCSFPLFTPSQTASESPIGPLGGDFDGDSDDIDGDYGYPSSGRGGDRDRDRGSLSGTSYNNCRCTDDYLFFIFSIFF
jgi:hypothetical protein